MSLTLIDAGPIIAYYNEGDDWHEKVKDFLSNFTGQFITTEPIITEAMCLLSADKAVQNELLDDVRKGLYRIEPLQSIDYARIASLNLKYADRPADFGDLSLIIISERLQINEIVSLDSDFDIYRRYLRDPFIQIFPRH